MTRFALLGLTSLWSITLTGCAAVPPVINAPSAAPFAFEAARLSGHIQTLGSDEFEGRAPNTPGETKTVAYLSDQFAKAGLQPGGAIVDGQRTWTQPVPLLKSEFAATPTVSVALGGKAVALTQGEEIAVRAPTNGDKAINLTGVPVVFVGYGVKAPERGWDDYKGVDVRGKVIVMLVNDPDIEGGEGNFGGKAMTYYGRWTYKYEEGARQGALHQVRPHRFGHALHGDRILFCQIEDAFHLRVSVVTDPQCSRRRTLFHAGRNVDGNSADGSFVIHTAAEQDRAGMNSDAKSKVGNAMRCRHRNGERLGFVKQSEPTPNCPLGVVLADSVGTKSSEDAVSRVLEHFATMSYDNRRQPLQRAV